MMQLAGRWLRWGLVTSLSRLAYAVGQPGQAVPSDEWEGFLNAHFSGITLEEGAALKRLLFESQTLILSDLREQVAQPDNWASRTVPQLKVTSAWNCCDNPSKA